MNFAVDVYAVWVREPSNICPVWGKAEPKEEYE